MTKSERRWCVLYSLILAVLTSIPYWIGYASQGDGWQFTGFVIGVEDGNSYIAKMLLGQGGAWLFRTPYTGMEQSGVLAYLPFLLLGKLASSPDVHLQLTLLYHLFRLAMIPVLVWATYRFTSVFLVELHQRRWATILASAGGGLGWVLLLVGHGPNPSSLPLEFISPESFGFLGLYALPHLALTRTLILIALTRYIQAKGNRRAGWEIGLVLMGSMLVQPLAALTCLAVIAAHQIMLYWKIRKGYFQKWVVEWWPVLWRVLLPVLPFIAYYLLVFSLDPYLKIWSSQNQLPSPSPLFYLLAYGLVLPFTLVGMIKAWRNHDSATSLLTGWILVFPLLAYFPYPVQRRLPEGVWVAFSILAINGLAALSQGWGKKFIMPSLVSISMVSSVVLILGGATVASRPAQPAFRPSTEIAAFSWLSEQASAGDLVLASYATGNALPAWAEMRVLIGLGPESANLATLQSQVRSFYDGTWSRTQQAAFVEQHHLKWIILGPEERNLGGTGTEFSAGWPLMYDSGGFQIYKTRGDS